MYTSEGFVSHIGNPTRVHLRGAAAACPTLVRRQTLVPSLPTRRVVTHTRSSHIQSTAVARPRDTTAASWTSRHPTVSRPRARLPTYLLLASYGAIGRSAPRPGPAPRPLARSPDQPAGAPPRGRARVRRPYYTLVVTRGFSLYRIGLYVTLYYN